MNDSDFTRVNTDNKVRLTLYLREKILGYNKGVLYSEKNALNERNSYFEQLKFDVTNNKNSKNVEALQRLDIIFRIYKAKNKKYFDLYKNLKQSLQDMGFKWTTDKEMLILFDEVYKVYNNASQTSDNIELQLKKDFQKLFQFQGALDLSEKNLRGLIRTVEIINEQKSKIISSPLEIDGQEFAEYKWDDTEYGDAWEEQNRPGKLPYEDDDTYSSDEEDDYDEAEGNVAEAVTEKTHKKVYDEEQAKKDAEFVKEFEEIKNYFKEFYEQFKEKIFGKEFWGLFLNDILGELKSSKTDEQLLYQFESPDYFGDIEAAHYLILHRQQILQYMEMVNITQVKKTPGQKENKDYEVQKPGNFAVKVDNKVYKNEAFALYDETNMNKTNYEVLALLGMDEDELKRESKLGLKKQNIPPVNKKQQLYPMDDEGRYDFVRMNPTILASCLPMNTERKENDEYIMFDVPPPFKVGRKVNENMLIRIESLEDWIQKVFFGMKTLNPIQTEVKPIALDTDENMLVCAPTGAGKTNVALMTILHEVSLHINTETLQLDSQNFKIIYVSPMKALAAEIVEKFQERLKPLKLTVKELTGDMQLSKQEILDTHVIVTTPEKWDVITRKSDGITATLKLIIFDEIHLLNDDRGPVIESIVARTLRNIERSQLRIRLVGLSATLPNPVDVAQFLRVNPDKGLFQFDSSFRPVPLHQRFIGVKEDKGKADIRNYIADDDQFNLKKKRGFQERRRLDDSMNEICYEIVRKNIKNGQQIIVFVHSRKETIKYAQWLTEKYKDKGEEHDLLSKIKRDSNMGKFKHKELTKLCPGGIGFHNAGLLRRDRNIVEKLFVEGNLRVLVTTATLAWGVNLPAHAVVIKGTDLYEPTKGNMDISILDIQQIFGRAGRPQYDTSGDATLITKVTKVNQFLGLMTNTMDIESQFLSNIKENLNAEISLGTVTNIHEAKEWLKYTFFYIRLMRNPKKYNINLGKSKDINDRKAEIEEFLQEILTTAVKSLHELRLIRHDQATNFLNSTELGRIASHFYIHSQTMDHFCKELKITDDRQTSKSSKFQLTDEKLLSIMSRAKEFENIRLRPEETEELNKLMKILFVRMGNEHKKSTLDKNIDKDINDKVYDDHEKVFALIQGYLLHCEYDSSSLIADTIHIVQNSLRILRCMLEITMKKNMANCVHTLLHWCKLIENKMAPDDNPLEQFCFDNNMSNYSVMRSKKDRKDGLMSYDLIQRLEYTDMKDLDTIREAESEEISAAIGLKQRGGIIKKYASYIPIINVEWNIKPIAQTILKMTVNITLDVNYTTRWHNRAEMFWIIVDDGIDILHSEQIAINRKSIQDGVPTSASFFIPVRDDNSRQYSLVVDSDRWIGSRYEEVLELDDLIVNQEHMEYTKLLDLQPLPKSALNNKEFETIYPKFEFFNPIQTQTFHALYHSDNNILIGAPTGSGKTIMAELAMLRVFKEHPNKKVIYVAPLKAIAKERLKDWRERLEFGVLKKKVLELTGDYTPDLEALKKSDCLITTPEKWDGISRSWQNRSYVKDVGLIIMDEIHLLGQDRGPVLEVIVSRMNYISQQTKAQIRMCGLSTALANGVDVANWFGVKAQYFFNFKPAVRPCPIEIHFDGFSEKHYCPRMATMNKPAYNAIKKFSQGKPVLIFVSSRRQTRLTALDLIALIAADAGAGYGMTQFLNMDSKELDVYIEHISDPNLKQTLSFGIGMHHAGLVTEDRKIVEELFVRNKIQVLIATSTLAWGVNFPAHLVIIKGTEFFDPKTKKYVDFPVVDLLQMIGRAGRPQFDTHGVAVCFVEQSKKNFYRKYLNDPFPVESSLVEQISDHFNAEVASGTIKNKQDCIEYLTWTYYFRRIVKNPTYYGVVNNSHKEINNFLCDLVESSIGKLENDKCVKVQDEFNISPTFLGETASFYYIKHETVAYFSENLGPAHSIIKLVEILAYAKEFEEIPLRHNEDNYNEALAKICPYPTKDRNYDSSNLKTFLLFQMYFGRLPPPIRDYVTDAKLAIDGSIRILHALIDIAADKGYLHTVLNLCYIMQMIVQGMYIHDSQLLNITHFTEHVVKTLHEKEGITYLCQIMEVVKENKLREIFKKHGIKYTDDELDEIEDCINYIPDVSFRAHIHAFDSDKFEKIENGKLIEGEEAQITVNLKRMNTKYPLLVQMERYSKTKDAGWWIICGIPSQNELLFVKKISFKDKLKREMQINLPFSFENDPKINVYLISDSYIGIDQINTIWLKPRSEKK